ncbi:hypothetical protein F2P56_011232, partial [Juglans regia]
NAGYPTPLMTTSSTTSRRVENIGDVVEDGIAGTSQLEDVVDGDTIEEPQSGMEFNSFEELMNYYKQYAKKCGFGVMTRMTEKGDDETVRYVTLGCARGGKARNRMLNVVRPRLTGKTKYINEEAGIRMNKSFGSLVFGTGGFENLPFLKKNCRNYINKARHLRLGKGGAGALQEYFCRMQCKNPCFFALMDLDDEGRLKNVFWADPRSRKAYQYFGDVVTFDTTYLTNRYGMPFAPFVGVNHHGQSILLGARLISNENTETFVWLFQTWLKCMGGIAPKAIITDQDRAMKNAIAVIFSESRHRLCLWHILKKVPEKLSSYASYKSGMKNALLKCVYDAQSVEEFEKSWDQLITTYNLHENAWLKSLYTE